MRFHILPAVLLCALPAASFGLTASMGLQFEDGSSSLIMAPGALGPIGVTTTIETDAPITGIQWALMATYDPDFGGPSPASNAASMFQFVSNIALSGKSANPFVGPSRLHAATDNGIFDATNIGNGYFIRGDYIPGHGPYSPHHPSAIPISWQQAYPEYIYIQGLDLVGPFGGANNKVATYSIASVGALPEGRYTLFPGNQVRSGTALGFYVCGGLAGCVVPGVDNSIVIDVIVPEPASVVLMLAVMVPLARRSSFARRRALT